MLDLKHATMKTEDRAIVTVRGYGFVQTLFWTASVEPSSPVESDVREPDCTFCTFVACCVALMSSITVLAEEDKSLPKLSTGAAYYHSHNREPLVTIVLPS